MAPYIWMPSVCLDIPHMFGFPPVCLDVCCTFTTQRKHALSDWGVHMPPYFWMPSVCLDYPHMFGCSLYVLMSHMFRHDPYVWALPCLDAHCIFGCHFVWTPPYVQMPPICLNTPYVGMPSVTWMHALYVWMTPYVWIPSYVRMTPCMFGWPHIFGHPPMFGCPIYLDNPYMFGCPPCLDTLLYVWMPPVFGYLPVCLGTPMFWCPVYVWKMFGCLLYIYNTKKAGFVKLRGVHIPPIHLDPHMFGCPLSVWKLPYIWTLPMFGCPYI